MCQVEADVLALVNAERRRAGLRPVVRDGLLDDVARYHSNSMTRRRLFSHDDKLGEGPPQRLRRLHPEVIGTISENIASHSGYPRDVWARQFMTGLMNSPGHRANILTADHTHLGLGVTFDTETGDAYLTQNFGTLIAARTDVGSASIRVRTGQSTSIVFRFLGRFDRSELSVYLTLPDSSGRLPAPDGRHYIGGGPVNPRWIDADRFAVDVESTQGPGTYTVAIGRNGEYPVGRDIKVVAR